MACKHKNNSESTLKLGNGNALSDTRFKKDASPPRTRSKTHPIHREGVIQTDSAPYTQLHMDSAQLDHTILPFRNIGQFQAKQQYERSENLQKLEVPYVEIEVPEDVSKMINNGCTSLSKVYELITPKELDSLHSSYHITIPLNQEYNDGHVDDVSGGVRRIFAATYSKKEGLKILRPIDILENGATLEVEHCGWFWFFGCESYIFMMRWDNDFTNLYAVRCREIYLTDQDGVSLLDSQHPEEDLMETLKFHKNRIGTDNDMFHIAQYSKRCKAAIEFFHKSLAESEIWSYEEVPNPATVNTKKKKKFVIRAFDSKRNLLSESRQFSFTNDGDGVHKIVVTDFEQEDVDNMHSYIIKLDTSLCEPYAQHGRFVFERSRTDGIIKMNLMERTKISTKHNETEKTGYEVILTSKSQRGELFGKASNIDCELKFPYLKFTECGLEDQLIGLGCTPVSPVYEVSCPLIPFSEAACLNSEDSEKVRDVIWSFLDSPFEVTFPIYETLHRICQKHTCFRGRETIINILVRFLYMDKPSGSQGIFACHIHSNTLEFLPTSQVDDVSVSVKTATFSPWLLVRCDLATIAMLYTQNSGLDVCLFNRLFMWSVPTMDYAVSKEEVSKHRDWVNERMGKSDFELASPEEKKLYKQAEIATNFLMESYDSPIQILQVGELPIPLLKSNSYRGVSYDNLWEIEFLSEGSRIGSVMGPYEFNENKVKIIKGVLSNFKDARRVDSFRLHIQKDNRRFFWRKSIKKIQWGTYSVKNNFLDEDDNNTLANAPSVPPMFNPIRNNDLQTIRSGLTDSTTSSITLANEFFVQQYAPYDDRVSTAPTSIIPDDQTLCSEPSMATSATSSMPPLNDSVHREFRRFEDNPSLSSFVNEDDLNSAPSENDSQISSLSLRPSKEHEV